MPSPATLTNAPLDDSSTNSGQPGTPDGRLHTATDPDVQESMPALQAQRLETAGLLAGGIANDLNIVLTPIVMSAALLDEQVHDPAARRVLSILHDAAHRGTEMVQQLIEFARLAKTDEVVTDPRRLLEDFRRLLAETFPRSIDLAIEVRADVPDINGDPARLHQLLANLCANARDAMPAGGLLTVRAESAEVDDTAAVSTKGARPGKYVVLSVIDNGCGIPPALRDRIFQPFFTTKANGRGLGLSTARDVARVHGGFITVDSEIERGTTVKVFLPVSTMPQSAPSPRTDRSMPQGRGELLLIVEDESSLRLMMAEVLTGFGYRVMTAANGSEAVAKFGRHLGEIAVVLADLRMPLMDGAFAVRALRTMDPAVRLIAVTGGADGDFGADAPPFAAVLPKPFRVEALLRILRGVLDR